MTVAARHPSRHCGLGRFEVRLPGLPSAYYVIEREGQRHPAGGDEVVVRAHIGLPAQRGYLLEEICFERRLHIAGKPLDSRWGGYWGDDDTHRWMWALFEGRTWKEAQAEAHVWARGELLKLVRALRARQAALRHAEQEEDMN